MGVYQEAYSAVSNVDRIVRDRIIDASETSSSLQATALETITALRDVNFDISVGGMPAPPDIRPNITVDLDLPVISPTSFGEITSALPDAPEYADVPELPDVEIPVFSPSVRSLNIPNPPTWAFPDLPPVRPNTGEVDLPNAPSIALPQLPAMIDLNIPVFGGVSLPAFSSTAPEFAGSALPGILQWAEPVYRPEILDEVMTVIRRLWDGGSGIPAAVELAMVERALSREEMITSRQVASVSEEFSARGFTMPTGMQAARADQMRQDLAVKQQGLNRELTIEFAKTQVENIRFGVTQAIAAENVLVNIFTNMAQRLFEAARFQVESQISIYNVQITLYNARMSGYQAEAQVFEARVRAELSKVEIYRAQVEAEVARGQINEQRVRTYSAQVQALLTFVEIYKAQMQGAQVQSEVIRSQIEAYRADVEAYMSRINAEKIRFDAYEAQIRGEAAKAGIIDSEARAYAALIAGKSTAVDIDVKRIDLLIRQNQQSVETYVAELETEKTRMQSQVAVIAAGAQAYAADTQRYAAQAGAETAKAQIVVSAQEASMRTGIAYFEAQTQAYTANMEQMIRKVALVLDSIKSAGQISSTLAAGAMAGVHVGATLSGSGGVSASGAFSESLSNSTSDSTNRNYNYEGT